MNRREFITLLGGAAVRGRSRRAHSSGDAGDWLSVRWFGGSERKSRGGVPRGTGGDRLRRGPERRHRISLGGQCARSVAGIGGDLVRRQVAVIATTGSAAAALAAKAATTTIPIVFGIGTDPVQAGLVASLNRPGGNVTGVSYMQAELAAKQLGLLHELLPEATRFAVLVNPTNPRNAEPIVARRGGGWLRPSGGKSIVNAASDTRIRRRLCDARASARRSLLVLGSPTVPRTDACNSSRWQPPCHARDVLDREYAEVGGLMSYGTTIRRRIARLGIYAGRILKGAEARRSAGRAADQVRVRHQSQDREGARPRHPADAARPRRRGDRVKRREFITLLGGGGGVAGCGAGAAAATDAAHRSARHTRR